MSKNIRKFRDLVTRRRQMIEMSTMEKNRLDVMPVALKTEIKRHVLQIQRHISVDENRALLFVLGAWGNGRGINKLAVNQF